MDILLVLFIICGRVSSIIADFRKVVVLNEYNLFCCKIRSYRVDALKPTKNHQTRCSSSNIKVVNDIFLNYYITSSIILKGDK